MLFQNFNLTILDILSTLLLPNLYSVNSHNSSNMYVSVYKHLVLSSIYPDQLASEKADDMNLNCCQNRIYLGSTSAC